MFMIEKLTVALSSTIYVEFPEGSLEPVDHDGTK